MNWFTTLLSVLIALAAYANVAEIVRPIPYQPDPKKPVVYLTSNPSLAPYFVLPAETAQSLKLPWNKNIQIWWLALALAFVIALVGAVSDRRGHAHED